MGTALEYGVAVHRCGVDRERIGGRAGVFVGSIRELAPADAEVCIVAGGRSGGDGSVHDRPLVADLGGVHRRAAPQLGLGGQTGDFLVLEHISVGCGDEQVNNAAAIDHTGEGNGQRMGDGKSRAFIFVGNHTAVVDAGQLCHNIGLDRENVTLCTAESIVRACGDGSVAVAHIPFDRGDIGGGDLVGGGADDIQTGCQNQVLRFPVRGIAAVVGVVHLRLGEIRADVARQRQRVIVVDNRKLTLCLAHVRSLL